MGATSPPTPGGQTNTIIGVVSIIVVVALIILTGLWYQKRRAANSQQGDLSTQTEGLSAIKRSWPGASFRHRSPKALSVIEEEGFGLDGLPLAPVMPAKPIPILLVTRPTQRDSLVQQKSRYYQKSGAQSDVSQW